MCRPCRSLFGLFSGLPRFDFPELRDFLSGLIGAFFAGVFVGDIAIALFRLDHSFSSMVIIRRCGSSMVFCMRLESIW